MKILLIIHTHCVLQHGHRVGPSVLLFCNNRYGNIFILHAALEELLQVSKMFVSLISFNLLVDSFAFDTLTL